MKVQSLSLAAKPALVSTSGPAPSRARIDEAVGRAARTIAPLWPLRHFVAVNPFLGLADRPFAEAAHTFDLVSDGCMTMPRAYYADAFRSGRMTRRHLAAALESARIDARTALDLPPDVAALEALLAGGTPASEGPRVPTVAAAVVEPTGTDWARIVTERISVWTSAYFDEGQASWRSPWRRLSPYRAWRAEASVDRTPEVLGARGFRAAVRRLPEEPGEAISSAVARLGLGDAELDLYLHRLLMTIGGWSAYARYRTWQAELYGKCGDWVEQLLAIRIGWEVALLDALAHAGAGDAWSRARDRFASSPQRATQRRVRAVDLVLQEAFERAWQERLVDQLAEPRSASASSIAPGARPSVQAAFCIDVRSEVYRRALEAVDPRIETIGFAGFFGFALEYVPLGQERGGAQCPVLLTPKVVVAEKVDGAMHDAEYEVANQRLRRRRAAKAWKVFQSGAISCFSFVGPVGLAFLPKLVTDGLGLTRPVPHPKRDGIARDVRLGPSIEPQEVAGRGTGLAAPERLAMAESVLRAMSLTERFARLVLLVGHGSTSVNNPHATGLDCGACGGHTGEANARVAAAVLNDPEVRRGLAEKGLVIPHDTVFVPGLHDTTTDEVALFDEHAVPATHREEFAHLRERLAAAARVARAERAPSLGIAPGALADGAVLGRSRDWSQVRPEWGLAGCAAFIAAPRHRTKGLDLGGRSFLHSYEWRQDEGFAVLELIMTAPMVVASWISLQYYGSTVDNRVFGSGNKVLHNVVGGIGVLEGNGGDLRTGLPWQSVHDGERFVHEPLRLNVVIEAPIEAMNAVIARHDEVRALLDNGWLHLWALGEDGAVERRYAGDLGWEPVFPQTGAVARRSSSVRESGDSEDRSRGRLRKPLATSQPTPGSGGARSRAVAAGRAAASAHPGRPSLRRA